MSHHPGIARNLKSFCNHENLLSEVLGASERFPKDHDFFASHILTLLNGLDRSIKLIDHIVVDCAKFEESWKPTGEFFGGENRELRGLRNTYAEKLESDIFSPVLFENMGNLISYSDIQSHELWEREELQKAISSRFRIKDVTGIAFPRPLHSGQAIVFYLFSEKMRSLLNYIDRDQLTAFLLPFYFCWLYRFEWIDKDHLINGLKSVADHTPTDLRALRIVSSTNSLDTNTLGRKYGSRSGSAKEGYSSLSTQLRRLFRERHGVPEKGNPDGYQSLMSRDKYLLLSLSGSSSQHCIHRLHLEREEREESERLFSEFET